jgi:protein-disulfide isomerase
MEIIEPQLTDAPESEPIVLLADAPIVPQPIRNSFDKTKLILPVAILLAGIMISGSILYNRLAAGQALIAGNTQKQGQPVKVDLGSSPFLGNKNAPVTVVEFGDFQCPFCRSYFQNNQPSIINEYVNNGKVKFVWKDYAFLGQESMWAAEAARCASDQNKFWEYHNYLYSHQSSENSGAFSKNNLKKFAQTLGLDSTKFNSCLDSDQYAGDIQKETQYGNSIGVGGTPASIINGTFISGAVAYSEIKAAIEAALNK